MTIIDPTSGVARFSVVPAAYVLFLRAGETGDEVLLQLRQNTGFMDGHWASAAAGHIERGETATDAARREAAEELGVISLDLRFATSMQRTAHGHDIDERVDFFFVARSWSPEPRILEPAKCADLRWCPIADLDRLAEPVVPHERYVLGLLPDVPALTSFGF
ncbi:MAG: NUDIX domain-containing protein [Nocardioidaceae bacterium]|nr:NUDIX domain-containing protein [Microbacteriaceae bacterium]MCL2613251.1 NUDIX domain-containing protein [Nocardioidaceae bacterium]